MATLGNSTTPGTGYFYDDTGNSQYMSGAYTMPAGGGVVTDIYVYIGGHGGSTTAYLCVWAWSGALEIQSTSVSLPQGTVNIGGQGWVHATIPNVYLPANTYGIGIWSAGNVIWTYESSGVVDYQHGVSGGPTTMSPPGTDGSGAFGAYIVYTPGGVARVRRSGAWSGGVQPEVRRSSAWSGSTGAAARRTTNWNQGT